MLLLEQKHLNLKRNHIEKIKEESAQMKKSRNYSVETMD